LVVGASLVDCWCTIAMVALGVLLYTRLETGFLPEMDEGGFVVDYWTPPGTSLAETDKIVRGFEDLIKKIPEVASFSRRTGAELGLFCHRAESRRHSGENEAALRAPPGHERSDQRSSLANRAERPGVIVEFPPDFCKT